MFSGSSARDSAAKDATGTHREVIIAYVYYPERFDRQIDRDGPRTACEHMFFIARAKLFARRIRRCNLRQRMHVKRFILIDE